MNCHCQRQVSFVSGLGGSATGGLQKSVLGNVFTNYVLPIATITAPLWGPLLGSLINPNTVSQPQSTTSPASVTTTPPPSPSRSNNTLFLVVGGVAVAGILFMALKSKSRK